MICSSQYIYILYIETENLPKLANFSNLSLMLKVLNELYDAKLNIKLNKNIAVLFKKRNSPEKSKRTEVLLRFQFKS